MAEHPSSRSSGSHRRWVLWQSKLDASAVVEFPRGVKPQPDDADWERVEVVEISTAWCVPEHGEDRNRRLHRYWTDPEYHARVYAAAQVLPKVMGGDIALEWALAAVETAERAVETK